MFLTLEFEPRGVSGILVLSFCLVFALLQFFCFVRTGYRPKVHILFLSILRWVLLAICGTDGAAAAAACGLLLLNLDANMGCTTVILLLLYLLYAVILRLAVCRWTAGAAACCCCKYMYKRVRHAVSAIEEPDLDRF